MNDRSLSDAATALAVQEYTEAVGVLTQPEPELERPACWKHPEWQPIRRGPTPRPSAALCPFCRDEATPDVGYAVEARLRPGSIGLDARLDRAYERHAEKMRADGSVAPGSPEEQEALDAIAAARDAERERDARKFGVGQASIASSRIEGGQIVSFPHGPRHQARRAQRHGKGEDSPAPKWRGSPDSGDVVASVDV